MFISIPKEFFVPVVFRDEFTLNEENNNLELDLSMYRENKTSKNNEMMTYMSSNEKEDYEKFCSDEGKIFEELDNEFIESINSNLKGCNNS